MPLNTNEKAFPILKVVFVKFQGKKDTAFRCPNRKKSTEISKAIFLLQNPAVCLYTSHSGKRVKGKISSIISAKWRSFLVIVSPDDVSMICISRASAL